MSKIFAVILLLIVSYTPKTFSQSSKARAESLAAEFSKKKNDIVTVEAKPDIRSEISAYAAIYEINGLGQFFRLLQSDDNSLLGEFYHFNSGIKEVTGTLTNILIEQGLLTGTFENRKYGSKHFEGVFINRFENSDTSTGIGIKQVLSLSNGFTTNKAFYKRVE